MSSRTFTYNVAWMKRWRDYLRTLGEVVPFDYPYMQARRKMPDRMPALV